MRISRLTLMVIFLFWGSFAQADNLTNADFLKFSEEKKHWWFAGAYESIGHMVFLHDKEKAKCVWSWLPSKPAQRKELLHRSFEKYPDHTPTSVVIALLQRDCGTLLPDN